MGARRTKLIAGLVRNAQTKKELELANWHTSLNLSKPESGQSLAAYSIPYLS